jgi:hypothetical protein
VKTLYNTVDYANFVLNAVGVLKLLTHGGKLLDIRKNPHAIDVGLGPSMRRNY